MKIAGFHSNHDAAYAILENGRPVIHAELERYIRLKEPMGDVFDLMMEDLPESEWADIKHFAHVFEPPSKRHFSLAYKESINKVYDLVERNEGQFHCPGHHQSHAANAFFSSNFNDALIITVDGGGFDVMAADKECVPGTFTAWRGDNLDIAPIMYLRDSTTVENSLNIGMMWSMCTEQIFGLSRGYPKGNQCGSVMAMACMGDPSKHFDLFYNNRFCGAKNFPWDKLRGLAKESEQNCFDIAAALQKATETVFKEIVDNILQHTTSRNLCLAGGVILNSVMTGKILTEWYGDRFDNVYVCPVPYDAGLAIGSAQWVWHSVLRNPRIKWDDNFTPYLGHTYSEEVILNALNSEKNVKFKKSNVDELINLLDEGMIVSVFSKGSESGRRALGNRSILADPRRKEMKDLINEKVKHRQWYRPFAPSILRERVKDWFETDHQSPYMSFVFKIKEDKRKEIPAVVHFDGSARLQTVTENDNEWYYNFLKKWERKSGVPVILNTSFNDREPIVETPEDAIKCFLGTDIDFLYFVDCGLMVEKNNI